MIKIQEHKEPQHSLASEKFLNPQKLYLPLSQHTGKPSVLCVKPGDIVDEGQLLAQDEGFISARLHSPKKGKVIATSDWYHPQLQRAKSIILECTDEERKYLARQKADSLGKDELIEIIKACGIVGMGGAAFPTHVKLNPPKPIDTLIINGCECEPYLASDCRLMAEYPEQIIKGIEIICRILSPKSVIVVLEDNKHEALRNIEQAISVKQIKLPGLKILVFKAAYPQGGEKQLIYSVNKRKVPAGGLPLDVGCVVHNVGTCFAIYEAVYFGKPLTERMVTFAGDALVTPKNIWLKIGITLQELFERGILEFKVEPKKIICGGPMMGIALDNLDYPILKGSGGFLFLSNNISLGEEGPCIRCGACVRQCPMKLMPCLIDLASRASNWQLSKKYGSTDCIECGVCGYNCPTNRRLVQSIKRAKSEALK
jgi:electron transport complex protein RnfC